MAVQCVAEHGLGLCSWLHKKTIDGSSAYIYGFIQMLTGIVQEIRDVNLPDTQVRCMLSLLVTKQTWI